MFNVSVIITTYNDEQYLNTAIQSVLEQSYPPVEIIVIDDGSFTKKAEKVVIKCNEKSNINICYFYQENAGPSSARNYGTKKSASDYIAFLDADDVWLPDNLAHKIQVLSKCDLTDRFFGVYGSYIFSDSILIQNFRQMESASCDSSLSECIGKPNGPAR